MYCLFIHFMYVFFLFYLPYFTFTPFASCLFKVLQVFVYVDIV